MSWGLVAMAPPCTGDNDNNDVAEMGVSRRSAKVPWPVRRFTVTSGRVRGASGPAPRDGTPAILIADLQWASLNWIQAEDSP